MRNGRILTLAAPRLLVVVFTVVAGYLTVSGPAHAQSAEDRYLAARDAAIERFTPARVPNIGQRELDAESKVRAELEKLVRAVVGSSAPAGFENGKFNLNTLFGGDMDFGKLDGLVYETDGGDTQMVVTTRSLFTKWLQAKWLDVKERQPDAAIRSERFFLRAIGSDAAIIRYAEIPLGAPNAFAMLANRTQDTPPPDANEVFVAAIRGERAFVAFTRFDPPLAIEACNSQREAAEAKLDELTSTELKPGQRNDAAMKTLVKMREQVEVEFRRCFSERAPKEKVFADAVKTARDLFDRMK